MLRRVALLLIPFFLFTLIQTSVANDSVPDNLPVISVDNASQIQELSSIGGALRGRLVWSPDNIHLAVGTSVGIQVYDSQDLDIPPIQIDVAGMTFIFNESGEIVVDGQRWDIATGEILADRNTNLINTPLYSVNQTAEGRVAVINRPDDTTVTMPVAEGYELLDIMYSPDTYYALLTFTLVGEDPYIYGYVELWNMEDSQLITSFPQAGNMERPYSLVFSANGDLIVMTISLEENATAVFIWDGRTGELLTSQEWVFFTRYSPDENLLALVDSGGISLWSNRELGTIHRSSEAWRPDLMVFSPDSHTIATPLNNSIVLWDISSELIPEEYYLRIDTQDYITELMYSPDGRYLASIEREGIAEVWDAQTGMRQARLNVEGDFTHRGVKFSPDGRFLRARDNTGDVYFLDIETDTTRIVELPLSAIINDDWSQAVYWDEGIVRIVSLDSGETSEIEIIPDYFGNIIGFSSESGLVMFSGDNISGYDLYSAEKHFEHAIPENSYYQMQFNSDGTKFILISHSRYNIEDFIEIWDTNNWMEAIASLTETGFLGYEFLYSPDNRYISELRGNCGEGGGGYQHLWDAQTGERIPILGTGGCGPFDHTFTPDGEWLIVAWDTTLQFSYLDEAIEQARTNNNLYTYELSTSVYYRNSNYRIHGINLSSDAEYLAVHLADVPFYETPEAPEPKIDIFHFSDILETENYIAESLVIASIPNATQALFSPDSRYILTDNGFWAAQTGEQIASISGTIASFNPDGNLLATYESGQVHLWDVDALINGSEQALLTVDIENVQELAFNPDSTVLFIKGAGDVQLWGIP